MADNYLEKKYEEYVKGKVVYRRQSPSLDTLIGKAGASASDPDYIVKQAQLDAMIRSARKLCPELVYESVEARSCVIVRVCENASDTWNSIRFGEACAVLKLKAAELNLHCSEYLDIEDKSLVITVFK